MPSANEHARFTYATLDDLRADADALSLDLPLQEDLSPLLEPVRIGSRAAYNAMAIQPMEGCDADAEGMPGPLTLRRYARFAQGGAGLIWVEACAVCESGRGNPRSLWLHEGSVDRFDDLVSHIMWNGMAHPYLVLQLQHAGRYSRPGAPQPLTAGPNPLLDPLLKAPATIATDDDIDALTDMYVRCARLAKRAGFDAVDIKASHGYLHAELLGAHTRPGKHGGSLENRARGLLTIVERVRDAVDIDIAARIGIYDAVDPRYGFGVADDGALDLTEPLWLAEQLRARGVCLLNITMGNPYYNPHINRPYDRGFYLPREHPLVAVSRLLGGARAIQAHVPDVPVMASGLTWLREFGANAAAAGVASGAYRLAGFGRQAFAYPDFPTDIRHGGMRRTKCCTTCSMCTELMRDGGSAGCVVRDADAYLPKYKQGRAGKPPMASRRVDSHV